MSIENNDSIVEPTGEDVDLETFSAEFFGQNTPEDEPTNSEEVEDSDDSDDADETTDEETTEEEDDTLAPEEDEEPEEEEEEAPKPKKSRAQERIEELNTKFREAERERKALEAKLEEIISQREKDNKSKEQEAPVATKDDNEPDPLDVNEDGTPKYPLGDFDPNYVKDITRYTLRKEREAIAAEEERNRALSEQDKQRAELQVSWNEKLEPAKERYPDFDEKGQSLIDSFSGIDPAYGDYLASTLMQMDHGPEVFYYLATHPEEAQAIVDSGPQKASIALGRLEASFIPDEEAPKARPKVSKAPPPPPQNKGSAVAKPDTPLDTDDLAAFSREFFKKR